MLHFMFVLCGVLRIQAKVWSQNTEEKDWTDLGRKKEQQFPNIVNVCAVMQEEQQPCISCIAGENHLNPISTVPPNSQAV